MRNRNGLLFCLLLLTSLLVSALGFYGKDSVYAAYGFDIKKQTLVSLPLKGMQDGNSLFSALRKTNARTDIAGTTLPDDVADASGGDPLDEEQSQQQASADSSRSSPESPSVTVEAPVAEEPKDREPEEEPRKEVPPEEARPGEVPEETPDETKPLEEETPGNDPASFPVPQGAPADDSYYSDALFIGDSRTVGLSQYVPGLDQHATFYCAVSLSIFNAMSAQTANVDGVSMSAEEALQHRQFGKIYLMVGINEIGYARDAWLETYRNVIARIRELQPSATIYIQSIMHVSSGKEASNPVFNNAEVNARNEGLKAFANGSDIVYIDINYLIDDANGALSADLTFDGVHLTAGAYDLWYQEIGAQTR